MPPLGVRPGAIGFRPPPPRREAPAYHAPLVYAPRPPATSFHAGIPSSHPFAAAVQQAHARAQRAERALPGRPMARTSPRERALQNARYTGPVPAWWSSPLQRYVHSGQEQARLAIATGREQAYARGEANKPEMRLGIPGLASINVGPTLAALATAHLIPGGNIASKIANEAIDFLPQSFLAGAQTGGAVRRGISQGKWEQAEALAKSAVRPFTHPVSSFNETPLSTLLMLAGGESGVGGAIGTAGRGLARAGMLPERTFARAAPDIALYGEGDLVPHGEGEGFVHGQLAGKEGIRISGRKYSRDPLRAAVQKVRERQAYGPSRTLPSGDRVLQATGRQLERNVAGGMFKVGTVDIAKGAEQRSRVSMVRGTVNRVMQPLKEKGGQVVGVRPKLGADAVPMLVENAIRGPEHFTADLEAELAKLHDAAKATDAQGNPQLTGPSRTANRANVKLVEGLLSDKKLQQHVAEKGLASEPYRAAARVRQVLKPLEAMLVHGGKLLPEQMRASLFSYAINHMGARHHDVPMLEAAEKASAARGESPLRQAEVGGRDVEGVRAHHETKATRDVAGERLAAAEVAHARARTRYDRLAGRQASARAREGEVGSRSSTRAEQNAMEAARTAREDARQAVKAAAKQHKQATADHEASPLPPRKPGLKGPHGEPLPTQTILDHMRHAGLETPGHISHVRGVAGKSSFYRNVSRQPSLENFARTGEAHAQGINDKSWAALVGSVAKKASESAQLELRRRFLNRFALDRFSKARDANHAIENFTDTAEGKRIADSEGLGALRAVHYGSGQIVGSEGFQGAVDPATVKDALAQFGLTEHTPANSHELGHYGVIPEHVLNRYQAHDAAMEAGKLGGNATRGLQAYARAWRRAKLNTSMPHIFGVMQEQAIRLLAEQVGPTAWAVGKKYDARLKRLAEVDKTGFMAETAGPLGEHFRQYEATMGGRGAIAASGRWQDVVRKADQFQETSSVGRLTRAGTRVLESKAAAPVRAAWHGWEHLIEQGLLRTVEEASHHAHMGKALRDTGLIDSYRSVLAAQGETVDAMIRGRLTPNAADAMARKVMDMYGNWTSQTPQVRAFVSRFAPFGMWYLNSLRWIYRLPVTHPVKTAVLAAMYRATKPQREAEGQGLGAPKAVPGFLQGTIPVDLPLVGKVKAAPAYYSPAGAMGAEMGQTAAEQLVPYLSGGIAALQGVNPLTREKVKDPHGKELGPLQIGLNTLAEGVSGPIPLSTQAQTALQGGGKPYGTANLFTSAAAKAGLGPPTVKPGTEHSLPEVLGKMISPVRIIRPKAETPTLTRSQVRQQLREGRAARRAGRHSSAGGEGEGEVETRSEVRRELREAREQRRRAHAR